MSRHVGFAILVLAAGFLSLIMLVPVVMGDCGGGARDQQAIKACVDALGRELGLAAIVWLICLVNLIWQHVRASRWLVVSCLALIILPLASALILGAIQADHWQKL
jgi:Na+-transporting NADH:ubiquinone oxidoreductase subunit NqrD